MDPPAAQTGSCCLNCATLLAGPFCHRCGQEAGPTHRSLLHIAAEFAEALTHGDGRLRRTLRLLAFRPGRLTRDYLDGRRAADIPPIRVFFWSVFLLFLVGSLAGVVHLGNLNGTHAGAAKIKTIRVGHHPRLEHWLRFHLGHAANDPAAIIREMGNWAERATLLMLPVAALTSKLLHLGRRPGIALFDHVIFAMHSLAFAMLLLVIVIVADRWWDGATLLVMLLPLHLFRHLRGAFGGGGLATAIRAGLLLVGELCGFTAIVVLLALIGLEFGLERSPDRGTIDRCGSCSLSSSPSRSSPPGRGRARRRMRPCSLRASLRPPPTRTTRRRTPIGRSRWRSPRDGASDGSC